MERAAVRLLIAFLAFAPALAIAGELWGVLNTKSYHFNRSNDWNENNVGLGLEYSVANDVRLIAGEYYNSYFRTSFYGGGALFSDQWKGFRLAASLGVLSGYPVQAGYDRLQPFLLPSVIWEGGRSGANLVFFPKCMGCDKASAGILLQLKARFR
jgi:hypothetical protein